jgi:4-hydroxybenzoate polyprenyltransferase
MLIKAYKWIQAISLDVVFSSGLLSLAIARYYEVNLPFTVILSLMIAVWLIYTYDHLSDAGKLDKEASTLRHRFHQQHSKRLKAAFLLLLCVGIGVVWLLPAIVIKNGLICSALVLFYFMLLKLPAFRFKEILVAVCYTIGVFLGPLSLSQATLNFFQLLLIPQVLLLALANLIIFSCFDFDHDREDGHPSLAISLGLKRSRKLAFGILLSGLILCICMLFQARLLLTQGIQCLILIMNLLLLLILLNEERFRQNDLYRIVGDGIFFIPSLILLYAR